MDGKRLNDIHDLTIKIDKMTTIIKALALTATFLAVIAVAGISDRIMACKNKEQIAQYHEYY